MIYEPSDDSYLLEEQIKLYAKDKTFLDMGSGSGIQATAAISSKAKSVTAVDINPDVIKHLKSLKIKAIQSNLFNKVKDKFQIIAFNPPYLPEDHQEDKESKQITTGGKAGDELIIKFLKQSKSHLTIDGIILLLLSSLTPKDKILSLLKKLHFNYEVISTQSLFMESLEVWKISNS